MTQSPKKNLSKDMEMLDATLVYALHNETLGTIHVHYETMATEDLDGPYLHAAYLGATEPSAEIQIEFLPGLVAYCVWSVTEHGGRKLFEPTVPPALMREVVRERFGKAVKLRVPTQESNSV